MKWVPKDPNTIFLVTFFTQKMSESSNSILAYSSILMISPFYLKWTEVTRDCKFLKFSLSPWGLTIGTKITIPSEFCPFQVKWWYHMFSSVKKEEYIESELSGLFQVKVAAKNIVFGSLGTQRKAAFAVWCLFLKKHTNILNQTVTLECFLC